MLNRPLQSNSNSSGGGSNSYSGKSGSPNGPEDPKWKFGSHKTAQKWSNQMAKKGWIEKQITQAIEDGRQFPAQNMVKPGNSATRYVHPETGQSVVIDNVANEIIQVSGDNFAW